MGLVKNSPDRRGRWLLERCLSFEAPEYHNHPGCATSPGMALAHPAEAEIEPAPDGSAKEAARGQRSFTAKLPTPGAGLSITKPAASKRIPLSFIFEYSFCASETHQRLCRVSGNRSPSLAPTAPRCVRLYSGIRPPQLILVRALSRLDVILRRRCSCWYAAFCSWGPEQQATAVRSRARETSGSSCRHPPQCRAESWSSQKQAMYIHCFRSSMKDGRLLKDVCCEGGVPRCDIFSANCVTNPDACEISVLSD